MTEPTTTVASEVTIRFGKQSVTVEHRDGLTILQTARWGGLRPPSQCEEGTCGTCMARCVEGAVEMRNNDVLDDDDLEEGWVLTCQAVPVSPRVHVVYE